MIVKLVISVLMFSVYIAEDNIFSWRSNVLVIANIMLWLAV